MLQSSFNSALSLLVAAIAFLFATIPVTVSAAAPSRAPESRLNLPDLPASDPSDHVGHRTPHELRFSACGCDTAGPLSGARSRAPSTPPGCGWSCGLFSGGVARRLAQPPATCVQPSGLKTTDQADVRVGPSMGLPVRPAYKLGDHPLLCIRTLLFSHCRHLTTHLSVRVRHSLPTRPTPNLALCLFAIWPFPSPLFSNSPLFTHSINSKFGPVALCHLAL